MGREDETPLTPMGTTLSVANTGRPGASGMLDQIVRFMSLVMIAFLSFISLALFLEVRSIEKRLRDEQDEIDELNDEINTEQKGEIDQLNEKVKKEHSFALFHMAGTFALLTCIITMFHMTAHLRNFNQPFVQRKILAILWMCPIYSITSFLSLIFPIVARYLDIVKDFYEAYVIYQFLSFLIAVLGRGNREVVVAVLARHADHLKPPTGLLRCFYHPDPNESDYAKANAVLLECQILAMQFVLFRPLTSISLFVLDMIGGGDSGDTAEEEEDTKSVWDYVATPSFFIVLVQNLSVFAAFTGLLKFYHAVHEDLAWCQPFSKFLCIKGVVFMTFWQGLIISIVANTLSEEGKDNDYVSDPDQWADSIQNLLICLEMLLFSIAHFCVFPIEEWEDGYRPRENSGRFGDKIALGDFVSDVKLIMSSGKASRTSRRKGKKYVITDSSTSTDDVEIGVDGLPADLTLDDISQNEQKLGT